jgi:hypothetical protein
VSHFLNITSTIFSHLAFKPTFLEYANLKLKFPNAFPSALSHNIGVPKVTHRVIAYLNGVIIKVDETILVESYQAISTPILFFSSHVSKNYCLGVNNISMCIYGIN